MDSSKNEFGSGSGDAVHNIAISTAARPPGDPAVCHGGRVGQVQAAWLASVGEARRRRFDAAMGRWKVVRNLRGVA